MRLLAVQVVRRLLAIDRDGDLAAVLAGQQITLGGHSFQVVGIYTTANDFGDNHVFGKDGFQAVYSANDGVAGDLYRNDGGRFTNVAMLTGTALGVAQVAQAVAPGTRCEQAIQREHGGDHAEVAR